MKKEGSFRIGLVVQSLHSDYLSVEDARQEVRNLMDDIWQRYPRAEVEKQVMFNEGAVISFEV